MPTKRKPPLERALIDLTRALEQFNRINSLWRGLLANFLQGITHGLGMLAAVAIVIPLVIYFLGHIQWIPLLGDFLSEISDRMREAQGLTQ